MFVLYVVGVRVGVDVLAVDRPCRIPCLLGGDVRALLPSAPYSLAQTIKLSPLARLLSPSPAVGHFKCRSRR